MRKEIIFFVMLIQFLPQIMLARIDYYPYLEYDDETGLSAGAALSLILDNKPQSSRAAPDYFNLKAKASLAGNFELKTDFEKYLENDRYLLQIPALLNTYSYYYGETGNYFSSSRIKMDTRHYHILFRILRKWDNYRFGFTYCGSFYKFYNTPDINELHQHNGIQGGWSLGPGLIIEFDSRDNHFFPQKGLLIRCEMQNFSTALGSDYKFDSYKLRAVAFYPVAKLQVFALKMAGQARNGNIPFQELADLSEEMRGYDQGSLKDKFLFSLSCEYRCFPFQNGLKSRFGLALFYETGLTAHKPEEFFHNSLHHSVGGGIRFLLNPEALYTLRFDASGNKHSLNYDFSAKEAF